jgi:DNA-binding transcriptional MerR regulator
MLPIGQAAKRTGIKVPTIRYYEQEGLLAAPARSESGRRLYSEADIGRLAFIRHARVLGFELSAIRSMLDLSDHPDCSCAEVDRIASAHLQTVRARMLQLRRLERELKRMLAACEGGAVANCRIIETLADHSLCADNHH